MDCGSIRVRVRVRSAGRPILATWAGDAFFRSMSPEGKVRNMDVVVYMDPPEHDKLRRIFNPWFCPGNVKRFEDQIRLLAKKEVARMMDYDGEVDFMKDIAGWYSLRAIVTLFGAPMEDDEFFMNLSKAFFGGSDPEEKREDVVADDPAAAVRIFLEELLPKLRSVELAGEPKYLQTNFVGGLKSLPIRFTKA